MTVNQIINVEFLIFATVIKCHRIPIVFKRKVEICMRSVNCEWVLVCFFMIVACTGRAQGGDLLGISPADTLDAGITADIL